MAGRGTMRMLSAHYDYLAAAVKPVMTAELYAEYRRNRLSYTRFVFDCMYRACRNDRTLGSWINSVLYKYLNDSHIGTALRRMAKEVGLADYD